MPRIDLFPGILSFSKKGINHISILGFAFLSSIFAFNFTFLSRIISFRFVLLSLIFAIAIIPLFSNSTMAFDGMGIDILAPSLSLSGSQKFPAINESWLVYFDENDAKIMGVHLYDGRTLEVSEGLRAQPFFPALGARYCVFVAKSWESNDIWAMDMINKILVPICENNSEQLDPAVGDNLIAWVDYRHGGSDLYIYDLGPDGILGTLDDKGEKRITLGNSVAGRPHIWGNLIIWEDMRGDNWDIFLYDHSTKEEKRLTYTEKDDMRPRLYQNYAVWEEKDDYENWNTVLYDLETGIYRKLTQEDSHNANPAIWGNNIYWQEKIDDRWHLVHFGLDKGKKSFLGSGNQDMGTPFPYGDKVAVYFGQGDTDIRILDLQPPVFSGLNSVKSGPSSGSVQLFWTQATDFLRPLTYNIYWANSPNNINLNAPKAQITDEDNIIIEDFPLNQSYYFSVRAFDSAGNHDENKIVLGIDIVAGDNSPPTIISTVPTAGAIGVYAPGTMEILFSEAMNQNSLQSAISISPSIGELALKWDGNRLFVGMPGLLANQKYTVTINRDPEDLAGNRIEVPYSLAFRTLDTLAPAVLSHYPLGGASDISISSPIEIIFSEEMDKASAQEALRVNDQIISGSFQWNGNKMIFDPSYDFSYLSDYSVTIKKTAKDLSNNEMSQDFTFLFTTDRDKMPPIFAGIFGADPVDSASGQARINWLLATDPSEPIEYLIFASKSKNIDYSVPFAIVINKNSHILTGLEDGKIWYFSVRAKDGAGNVDDNKILASCVPGSLDNQPPRIVQVIPEHGEEDIPGDYPITINFSEAINRLSAQENFSLNPPVDGYFSWPDDMTMVFNPTNGYGYDKTITVNIRSGVKDLAGNGSKSAYISTFITAQPPDLIPPRAVSFYPQNGAFDIAVDIEELWIAFDEALEPTSSNALSLIGEKGQVEGIKYYDPQCFRLVFRPGNILDNSTKYSLSLNSSMVFDLAGNEMTGINNSVFTTEKDEESPVFSGLSGIAFDGTNIFLSWPKALDNSLPIRYLASISNTSGLLNFEVPTIITEKNHAIISATAYENSDIWACVRAQDSAGNMDDNSVELAISIDGNGALAPPYISWTNPIEDQIVARDITLEIFFTKPMNNSFLSGIYLQNSKGIIQADKSFKDDDLRLIVKPINPLSHGEQVKLIIENMKDKNDISLVETKEIIFFVEEEKNTEGPEIVSVFPAHGSVEVDAWQNMTIVFSREIAPWTLNSATVLLNNGKVKVQVSLNGNRLTIIPVNGLPFERLINLYLSPEIKDIDGNPLRGDGINNGTSFQYSFKTGDLSSSQKSKTIFLHKGLNLISLPIRPIGGINAKRLCQLFDLSFIMRFDSISSSFQGYLPREDDPGFNIETEQGYLVHAPFSMEKELQGLANDKGNIIVKEGWNLVGMPIYKALTGKQFMDLFSATALIRTERGRFLAYLPDYADFTINEGEGLLIKVDQDNVVNITDKSDASPRNLAPSKGIADIAEKQDNISQNNNIQSEKGILNIDYLIIMITDAIPGESLSIKAVGLQEIKAFADKNGSFSLPLILPGEFYRQTLLSNEKRENKVEIEDKNNDCAITVVGEKSFYSGILEEEHLEKGFILLEKMPVIPQDKSSDTRILNGENRDNKGLKSRNVSLTYSEDLRKAERKDELDSKGSDEKENDEKEGDENPIKAFNFSLAPGAFFAPLPQLLANSPGEISPGFSTDSQNGPKLRQSTNSNNGTLLQFSINSNSGPLSLKFSNNPIKASEILNATNSDWVIYQKIEGGLGLFVKNESLQDETAASFSGVFGWSKGADIFVMPPYEYSAPLIGQGLNIGCFWDDDTLDLLGTFCRQSPSFADKKGLIPSLRGGAFFPKIAIFKGEKPGILPIWPRPDTKYNYDEKPFISSAEISENGKGKSGEIMSNSSFQSQETSFCFDYNKLYLKEGNFDNKAPFLLFIVGPNWQGDKDNPSIEKDSNNIQIIAHFKNQDKNFYFSSCGGGFASRKSYKIMHNGREYCIILTEQEINQGTIIRP